MALTPGPNLNSVPAPKKQTLSTNYLDFQNGGTNDWGQQYVPDLMAQEAEVFGNRTISGFLSQVGAEEAMTSDQVIWSEQGRLHLSYKAEIDDLNGDDGLVSPAINGGKLIIEDDIDANSIGANHGIRANDTLLISTSSGTLRALVESVDGANVYVAPYGVADLTSLGNEGVSKAATVLVYGSEYGKAKNGRDGANEPGFETFHNKPVIMKDKYEISGSDTGRIGWIEVTGEAGQSGYMWYLKAEGDTRARFADHLEMTMMEAVKGVSGTDGVDSVLGHTNNGTQGLFDAIEDRGNVTSGITGVNAATDLAEFDAILAEFDNQGAIEENMMFLNRATSLAMDDMLASMNSYGAGGTSYGVFSNSEDMALNLGFMGFRRGSYDFYKSDFKYLNDKATRGSINAADSANAIRGIIVPAGVSSVYDQMLGKNLKRPFLHVRYKASATDDRRFKTWTTGSVGGNITSDLDAMEIHFLSERCLVTQGANNFMMIK